MFFMSHIIAEIESPNPQRDCKISIESHLAELKRKYDGKESEDLQNANLIS